MISAIDLTVEDKGHSQILHINGTVDSSTNLEFGTFISNFANKCASNVVLNLKGLSYLNSMGLGTILSNIKMLQKKGCRVAFAEASDEVDYLFKLTGLSDIFFIYDSVDKALASFKH